MPALLRLAFAISAGVVLILTVAAPVYWIFFESEQTARTAMVTLIFVGWSWLWLIGLRLLSEWWIVLFAIHERLGRIDGNTAQR